MSQIEHVLKRTEIYAGSKTLHVSDEYVANEKDGEFSISREEISFPPALLRIFIEALSNAIDNVETSKTEKVPCTHIKVNIDANTGETRIWNDGSVVPVELHEDGKTYNHSMIFGELLTGSNYNDDKERVVSGRNGLGIKLCNIFSEWFQVTGVDPKNKKMLKQVWTRNMRDTKGPKITSSKLVKGYTEVAWIPDFKQFKMKNGYTRDIIRLYTRYVLDAAMLSKVKVSLNGAVLPVKNLDTYAKLYIEPGTEKLYIRSSNADVVVVPSKDHGFHTISFVNGVYTRLGGTHVDAWVQGLLRPLIEKYNGKTSKSPKITLADVKPFFTFFVSATVDRPQFNSQEKERLDLPAVPATVKKTHITAISKWTTITDKIDDLIRSKEMQGMKKMEKKRKNVKVEGLDPANKAGGKSAHECTLIICEGLSAKTYAVAGINHGVYGKTGRDWFGILPLTGKLLNVRNASLTSVSGNKVINSLIHALDLRYGMDYTKDANYRTLKYGRVMVMTDADVDGIHIEGLLMNFLHALFPSVLRRSTPYVVSMKTPIARIIYSPRSKDQLFYDESNFVSWISHKTKEERKKFKIKYYKGLGTTKPEDVPDTFGLKMVEYNNDAKTSDSMNKVFKKTNADERKTWLGEYVPGDSNAFSLDSSGTIVTMPLSSFINNEMVKFSHADCARSIPNIMDGLKESQRKILYAVRKRKLKYSGQSLKVAQLSGYTAEHSNYHHGEQNLQNTIIGMANEFPGTNNIPLLYRDGMFGTRLEGAKDAASARYIFTKMDALTEYIFKEEDDALLTQVNDDGDLVQPEHYVPIVPMILVNGCTAGIGTGWSCSVPCYNILDIIQCIREWLENNNTINDERVNACMPWYRGFKGKIERDSSTRFVSHGCMHETTVRGKETYNVTELPVGMWTSVFKDKCEDLVSEKKLKYAHNYSTPRDVMFTIAPSDTFECDMKTLKLHSYISSSNMVLFNEQGALKKHANIASILDDFCKLRYVYYVKRKAYQVKKLETEVAYLTNKERFVSEVIQNVLEIMNIREDELVETLKRTGYDENPRCDNDSEGGYEYLLRMQVRTFTHEKVKQLEKDIQASKKALKALRDTSEKQMWNTDLDMLEKAYKSWEKDMDKVGKNKQTKNKK